MWTLLWFALLTAAGLCYPRRPRVAGMLFVILGALSIVLTFPQRAGYQWGVVAGVFWIALGAWQLVKFHNPNVRAKHIEYWTAKA
jgi:hypothetical protein